MAFALATRRWGFGLFVRPGPPLQLPPRKTRQVRDIEELMKSPVLGCHPLKGNRAGQYAVNITGFYRLILSFEGEMLEIVRIEEVSKHYGD